MNLTPVRSLNCLWNSLPTTATSLSVTNKVGWSSWNGMDVKNNNNNNNNDMLASLKCSKAAAQDFCVLSRVANTDFRLKPGMFASVDVTLKVRDEAVVIPEAALILNGDQVMVFVVDRSEVNCDEADLFIDRFEPEAIGGEVLHEQVALVQVVVKLALVLELLKQTE